MATQRIPFVDRLRGIALVAMVFNHSALYLLPPSLDPARQVVYYLTATLAAPVFLFVVGFSLVLATQQSLERRELPAGRRMKKTLGRAAMLVAIGFLVNIALFPSRPFYAGDILQTIGLGILILTPILPRLSHRTARHILLVIAVLAYLLFDYSYPAVLAVINGHPGLAQVLFQGFPPWPWISLVAIGCVLGVAWLEACARPGGTDRYISQMLMAGIASLALYFTLGAWQGQMFNFSLSRDHIVRGHWLPAPITALWIVGLLCLSFAAVQRLDARLGAWPGWLVHLGQAALPLYVLHLLIIKSAAVLSGNALHDWFAYLAFNVLLLAALTVAAAFWLKHRNAFSWIWQ